jgi:hypothetical protein
MDPGISASLSLVSFSVAQRQGAPLESEIGLEQGRWVTMP